ncbi:non-homologous end-joining DNA ligase [Phenylobacterium sp.]|jgi:DNA ligase D-like protein (predicted polymerase)|uniref:non-homologous end-joining DNA ligase n=1 Tax=Phenylobacterium sp. TaxID=1871053 RepID=UPI002E35D67C|nr:non-homologous end-joining DNA ligase [Phenylobacterium sp.]HEX2559205.1 non-homologous end-joining DNA ligase [Phenylobacterium sp.]
MARRRFIQPDLPSLAAAAPAKAPPTGAGWRHEVRLAGVRRLLRIEGGKAVWDDGDAGGLKAVGRSAAKLADGLYEAELCALDAEDRPVPERLEAALAGGEAVAFLHDLLFESTDDIRALTLEARLERLAATARPALGPKLRLVQPLPGGGQPLLDAACRLGLPGIVSRRLDAAYGAEGARLEALCGPPPPQAAGRVHVDRADKALWPAHGEAQPVTKADLAGYYEAIAPWLLPYIAGRPCTVVTAPDGVFGEVTWVRHEGHWQGSLRTSPLITHWTVAEKAKTYPGFDTAEALVQAADMAIVEIHPWNSVPGQPMLPGRLVFDLDPEEGQALDEILAAAVELKARLARAGLAAFLKSSGKRGVHLVTPLLQREDAPTSWQAARDYAKRLCLEMAADSPGLYTTALPKAQRRGRIFLDYLRNDPGHHAVALLSPRAVAGAPVSMPLDWADARKALAGQPWTVRNAAARLRKRDPWADLEAAAAPLPP